MNIENIRKLTKKIIYSVLFLNFLIVFICLMDLMYNYLSGNYILENNILFNNLHLVVSYKNTFMDFFNSIQYGIHPYVNKVIYPPFINAVFALFGKITEPLKDVLVPSQYRFTVQGIISFFLFSLTEAIVCFAAIKTMPGLSKKEKIFLSTILLFTEPFIFCLERGNCILLSYALTLIFVNTYRDKDTTKKILGIVCLAMAVGIKIYPVFFGLLLIRERDWKAAALAILIGSVVMFVPFIFFAPEDRSISLWISNIVNCSEKFQMDGYGFKVNLSNTLKVLESYLNIETDRLSTVLICLVTLANCLIVIFDKKIDDWKTYMLLSLILILIPSFSYTYTMIFVSIPFFYFLISNSEDLLYIPLYISSFVIVPLSNQFSFFKIINENVKYPYGLTNALESISLLMFEIFLLVNCFYMLLRKPKKIDI